MRSKVREISKILHVLGLICIFFNTSLIASEKGWYNVNDYEITGDSTKLHVDEINKLIVKVHENGGGTIYFPAGVYLTGPITLLSNITLYLDEGSKLKFSDDFDLYLPMVETRFEGVDIKSFHPLIYAYKAHDISIVGSGVIEGQGRKWWLTHFDLEKKYKEKTGEKTKYQKMFLEENEGMIMPDNPFMFEYGFCRPPLFQPMYCTDVKLEGVTFQNSPFWTVNPEFCENLTIHAIKVVNPDGPNTDGINPESCKNVRISDCHISVGDDCITIKSGKDLPGRTKGVACENITITNCTMLTGHGGVVIGSEMSGDVKNVVISNCIFDGTDRGIRIKSTRGRGGVVEDIRVSNVVMRNILKEAVMINLFYSNVPEEPVSERTPAFRDIHISNVTGEAKKAIAIIGLPERPVSEVTFNDIDLDSEHGVDISAAENITFSNVTINNKIGPAFKFINSSNIELGAVKTMTEQTDRPVIYLENTKNVAIYNSLQTTKAKTFVELVGSESESVYLGKNYLIGVSKPYSIDKTVPKGAFNVD